MPQALTTRRPWALLAVPWLMAAAAQAEAEPDWRDDWALADGLTMEIDSRGYNFPVQTAFVPDPGPEPRDALYFVVELKGHLKAVSNDRRVHAFAADFLPNPQGERFVQAGAAGICLDPVNGYVFATFAYLDDRHVYRNGIVRFESEPRRFGLREKGQRLFLDLFKDEVSATDHQIGPCQVKDGHMYVSVGYGVDRAQAQNRHSTLGSILRMSLDFAPVADNPFYEDDGRETAIDYLWAYGFRNPFGLRFVGDRLFATDNGGNIDRFDEVARGENHLWNGTDWGIGARAAQVFAPAIGIVHLDFIPPDNMLFPEPYRGRFVAAAAGAPGAKGPGNRGRRSVVMLDYDFENRRMAGPPREILRYRGEGNQIPVSATMGPDGLYFVALLPDRTGESPVYRLRYDPAAGYPHRLGEGRSPQALINRYQCRECHKIEGQGGTVGPALDATLVPRLIERLNAPEYPTRVAEIDRIDTEPFAGYRAARREVLAATGEERVRRWLKVFLRQSNFDNPEGKMPPQGLSEAHATLIARYLIESTTAAPPEIGVLDRLRFWVARQIPDLRYRHLVVAFLAGGAATAIFLLALYAWVRGRAGGP
ncbi:MAG: PQQ-dependent sugar dehydrogenase [Kiloniellales bacterium]